MTDKKPNKVIIKKDTTTNKKMVATFFNKEGKKIKTTRFGADGMSDFTKHKDPARKKRYLDRHKKREDWSKPMTAGALSKEILWNKPTLQASISSYKKKFNLK
tara:strand:+ start:402 stop:710 length:309 start_codon:yes stop_codon:yes gene_type:complete